MQTKFFIILNYNINNMYLFYNKKSMNLEDKLIEQFGIFRFYVKFWSNCTYMQLYILNCTVNFSKLLTIVNSSVVVILRPTFIVKQQ